MNHALRPRVSVIIPAYRVASIIGRALDSLLKQTRPPDEILVIDDGSPDDLEAALASYASQIRLYRKTNGGAASARNYGIERAEGNVLSFLDADDYWEHHKLEQQLALLERYPELGLVASHFYQEPPGQPRFTYPLPPNFPFDRVVTPRGPELLPIARKIWTSTVIVRRSILGSHRFDTSLVTAEDVDLWIRLALAAPVYLISQPLATAVLTEGSLSRSNVGADASNMLTVLRRHASVLGRAGTRAGMAQVYREWAAGHLGNGEPREAIVPAWQRLRHEPCSAQGWWILGKSLLGACTKRGGALKPQTPMELT